MTNPDRIPHRIREQRYHEWCDKWRGYGSTPEGISEKAAYLKRRNLTEFPPRLSGQRHLFRWEL